MAQRKSSAPKQAASPPGGRMLIGPHVSAAGGLSNAIANGERVDATCIQVFTRNQRTWNVKPLEEDEVTAWREAWGPSQVGPVMSHDSYLINLGSPVAEKLERSREAFAEEARRCDRLGIDLLNFHPGAHMGDGREKCIQRIVESVREVMDMLPDAEVIYTIENTAGQGSVVGHTLEDLADLLEGLDDPARTGICLDTCHLFAAGYDLVDEKSWDRFWKDFDRLVGLRHLRAFHVNDSKKPLHSRVDRHEALGEGCMGIEVFRRLARDPRFVAVPMFLETPGEDEVWGREIEMMRAFREGREAA